MKNLLFLLIILATSCSTISKVAYVFDRSINFKKLKTYAWSASYEMEFVDKRYNNHIIESNIKFMRKNQYRQKG
jgi:hypothetical protein